MGILTYFPTFGAGGGRGGFLHCGVWTACLLWGHLPHPPCSSVKTEQQSLYITNQTMSFAFIAMNCEYKINKTSFDKQVFLNNASAYIASKNFQTDL